MVEVEAFVEHNAHGILAPGFERAERIGEGYVVEHVYCALAARAHGDTREYVIEYGGTEQAPQNGAFYVLLGQDGYYHHADKRDYRRQNSAHCARAVRDEFGIVQKVEGYERGKSGIFIDYHARLLQSDERDKQTYTYGNCVSYACGNGFENLAPQSRKGENEEDDAVNQNEYHAVCIGKSRAVQQGEHDKCVYAHAGSLRQRHSCKESHEESTHDCAHRRGDIRRAVRIFAAYDAFEHTRIYHEDIYHRHERGDTRNYFRLVVGTAFRDTEPVVHLAPKAFFGLGSNGFRGSSVFGGNNSFRLLVRLFAGGFQGKFVRG